MDLAYDGRDFAGWARQPHPPGLRTVQGEVEHVLGLLCGVPVEVTAAGRTDAGVHARRQVAHTDLPADVPWPDAERINRALPDDVRLLAIGPAPEGFDARFSAIWRRYTYRVCDDPNGPSPLERHLILDWTKPLDLARMNEAAGGLMGEHDFAAYCKQREFASSVREILDLAWHRREDGVAVMTVRADAFCHSMVRSLVGAMLPVGDHRRPVTWPAEVLASLARHPAVTVMPPHPLILEEIGYPPADRLLDRQRETRSFRTLGGG